MNGLENTWGSKIATTNWKIGELDIETARYSPIKEVYNYEINNPSTSSGEITYEAKIGLMYFSDYRYAASPDYWTTTLFEERASDWMYLGINEWTISQRVERIANVFILYSDYGGSVYYGNVIYALAVRPVFYLNSNVQYISGSGTQSDPFRIA